MRYREHAKKCVERARLELETNHDDRIAHAALELRFALEALTYDRAAAYRGEFPESEYRMWQPRKVMRVLLEIDPTIDFDVQVRTGREELLGVQASNMQDRGVDKKLSVDSIKKHYDALGNYLHVPTISQLSSGNSNNASQLRNRCSEIVDELESILTSKIHNVTLGDFVFIDCQECGNKIRKRILESTSEMEVASIKCTKETCLATYSIIRGEHGSYELKLDTVQLPCGNALCDEVIVALKNERKEGSCWTCKSCQTRNVITLGVVAMEEL